MADCPEQGADSGDWGTKLRAFFAQWIHLSGTYGGLPANVCNDNYVVCNENEQVFNTDRSLQ